VEALVVASRPAVRAAQLRRALQSERHVLCVHPVEPTPESAYEAAMIQGDTGRVLMPILTEALHPALARLAQMAEAAGGTLGAFQIIMMERRSPGTVLARAGAAEYQANFPGWDVLRALRGEIAEVTAFAANEAITPEEPIVIGGRFERGGLFQATFLPQQPETSGHLAVIGTRGQADLIFPQGWTGPARLTWRDAGGNLNEEKWNAWNPGPVLVEALEAAL